MAVNKQLVPIKVHYFLITGAMSGVMPLIPVYALQLGISSDVVGYMFAVLLCLTTFTRPAIGAIVDYTQKLKLILIILITLEMASNLSLNFIPSPQERFPYEILKCYGNSSYLLQKSCAFNDSMESSGCNLTCNLCQYESALCSTSNDTHTQNAEFKLCNTDYGSCQEAQYSTTSFKPFKDPNSHLQTSLLIAIVSVMYICYGPITSLSDAACFNTLGSRREMYGQQRMWGSIGWGLFSVITGIVNQVFTGDSSTYSFSFGFYLSIVLFLIDTAVIQKISLVSVSKSKSIGKDVGKLLVKPKIILFLAQLFIVGTFVGFARTYQLLFLRTMGASQLNLGITTSVKCFVGELPFFFLSGWIIGRIGHLNTFTVSFVALGVKFLAYSYVTNPWYSLLLEALQGVCLGSLYSAVTSYAKLVAPEGTEATMQGLATGVFENLGVASGSFLGGCGFHNFGGRATFFWAGVLSFVTGSISAVVNFIVFRKE